MPQSSYIVQPTATQSSYVVKPDAMASATFQTFSVGGAFANPSNIATGAPTLNGSYASFTSQNPATASPLANAWAVVSFPARNAAGQTAVANLIDTMRLIVRTLANSPPTDIVIGAVLHVGSAGAGTAPGAATKGVGVIIGYNAAGWQVGHTSNGGAGWTNAFGVANASVVGGRLLSEPASSTQARFWGLGLDSSNATVTGTASANAFAAIGDSLDTVSIGFGWLTGVGGAGGAVTVKADLFNISDTSANLGARSP